jgi:hypothetical protein
VEQAYRKRGIAISAAGELQPRAGRRGQQERQEDRERAEHGFAAYALNAAASPGRAGG